MIHEPTGRKVPKSTPVDQIPPAADSCDWEDDGDYWVEMKWTTRAEQTARKKHGLSDAMKDDQ